MLLQDASAYTILGKCEEETSRHPGYPLINLNDLTKFLPVYRREA